MAAAPALPEVPLVPGTLVIGDLHLDLAGERAPLEAFRAWLESLDGVTRLVILGDLFDAWIGPAHLGLPGSQLVVAALAALVGRGTQVDVVPGNRDFLLEHRFEAASGARVRPAGMVGLVEPPQPGGPAERVLLIHGDELCTRDHAYQRLRRVLRSGPVLWSVPRIPRPVGLWIAGRLRRASVGAVAAKPPEAKAQQAAEVTARAALHRCDTVVCGHAHVFRDERLPGGPRWLVVGAYGAPNDVLEVPVGGVLEVRAPNPVGGVSP